MSIQGRDTDMNHSKSSLFLMEMIIVILFFSLAASVCLQIFVKAHLYGRDTEELNTAVLLAENAGELFYEYEDAFPQHEDLILEDVPEGYEVTLKTSSDENFLYLDYAYIRTEDHVTVYELSFKDRRKEGSD